MGKFLGLVLLLLVGYCAFSGGSVNEKVVESLRPKQIACRDSLQIAVKAGLFTSDPGASGGEVRITANEVLWNRLDYDDKVRQGLMVYCSHMPSDGRLTVWIKGSRSGNTLGSVQNGHWFKG